MSAYLVLASLVVLLGLLIHGRIAPAYLFSSLAALFYMSGLIDQKTFLSGFSNPALVTLLVLLMASLALERSPLMENLAGRIFGKSITSSIFRLTIFSLPLSAFLNNTAVVSIMLGQITKQKLIPASKLLIPLSYASILGGIITLVGTSTNMVVNSFAVNAGLPAIGMFQFAWVGLPVALVCLVVLLACSRLLPTHAPNNLRKNSQEFFLEAKVLEHSPLIGKSIEENHLRRLDGLFLVEIIRSKHLISPVAPSFIIESGDTLIFSGETHKLQALQQFQGLAVFGGDAENLLASNLVEVIISSESTIINKTLRDVDFRTMFDAAVVGIRRGDRQLTGQLGHINLHIGDCLLLAAGSDFWQHKNLERNFHILDGKQHRPKLLPQQNIIATVGFFSVIALSAAEILPLLDGLLMLTGIFLLTRILTVADLRRRFPFELILIIGSALGIAHALENSGAANLIAGQINAWFSGYGPIAGLIGVYLATVLMTELVTNNAAAAIAFPFALSTANAFGADPMPFVMVVAYGASACFLLPFGYQTHLMVYSPGRYRVIDFLRIGLPVSLAYGVTVLSLVPVFFPFH